MTPTTRCTGGYQNLKIIDFELGNSSKVVRWGSYLVGMQYPWVLQVGKRSDSSDNSILPKISILGRLWNQAVKCAKTTYNYLRTQNQGFELPRHSRVLGSPPYGFYLWNSRVLSIPRVSEPSDNFSSQKSGFWGKSWDQCTKNSKTTYIHLRAQNRDFELSKHFRVLGSTPYGFYVWNSRVQLILKFSEPSD